MSRRTPLNNLLTRTLHEHSPDGLLPFEAERQIATRFDLPLWEVEHQALEEAILPLRYTRNRQTIDTARQLRLLDARVAIIGCGGLGGHVAEMLTRIGVGHLTLIDPDTFDEHNLNRQNFSTLATLGQEKVQVLKHHLLAINPATQIRPITHRFDPAHDMPLIDDADVVIDALDDPAVKLTLAAACQSRSLPFIHGAIAGMDGQLAVNTTLEHLYRDGTHGAEETAGNLSFSAAFIASLQAAETVKLLLDLGESLEGEILITDLMYGDFTRIRA